MSKAIVIGAGDKRRRDHLGSWLQPPASRLDKPSDRVSRIVEDQIDEEDAENCVIPPAEAYLNPPRINKSHIYGCRRKAER